MTVFQAASVVAVFAVVTQANAESAADHKSKAAVDFLVEAHMALGLCHEHISMEDRVELGTLRRKSPPELQKALDEAEVEGVMMSRKYDLDAKECKRLLDGIAKRRATERKAANQ